MAGASAFVVLLCGVCAWARVDDSALRLRRAGDQATSDPSTSDCEPLPTQLCHPRGGKEAQQQVATLALRCARSSSPYNRANARRALETCPLVPHHARGMLAEVAVATDALSPQAAAHLPNHETATRELARLVAPLNDRGFRRLRPTHCQLVGETSAHAVRLSCAVPGKCLPDCRFVQYGIDVEVGRNWLLRGSRVGAVDSEGMCGECEAQVPP